MSKKKITRKRKRNEDRIDIEALPLMEGTVVEADEDKATEEVKRRKVWRRWGTPMPLRNIAKNWQGRTPDELKINKPEEERYYRVKAGSPRFSCGRRKRVIKAIEPLLGRWMR